ncbi:MAG: HlyD family efflux transporter periplasmic adaptor subunit [Limimaricola sp.]|uniref:HlyD family secretion protein n=1 Tax=Limimaricola sp. TaxID=2211665 RepID=UPI001DD199F6|nr:HlyD family efflux transporter periplasmic adaptor subunit [Limimaricola sp.]MBI1416028.1 HlyD family efflux transporter periplasmic adaptor subunit [Limimaricola sp.]
MSALWSTILGYLAVIIPALGGPGVPEYNGYIEADYTYVAATSPGRITALSTTEGAMVKAGDLLLTLDDTAQQAALKGAQAAVAQAQANLDNLMTGSRPEELDALRAALHQAQAQQVLAQSNFERSSELLSRGMVPSAKVDSDKAALDSANAQVEQLTAQLRVAELPARNAQRLAAEAALDVARAQADQAQSALDDRSATAPIDGKVEHVFYDVGEVAATGAPIISIFQPDALKVIFFIPEPERAAFAIGDAMSVSCDGCGPGLGAHVTLLGSAPQYTPPIIYSRSERQRLVFRAEARLDPGSHLLPGQPVSLTRADAVTQ